MQKYNLGYWFYSINVEMIVLKQAKKYYLMKSAQLTKCEDCY